MSRLVAAAVEDDNMGAGGLREAPAPTIEQRLQQSQDQVTQMHAQCLWLQQELEDLKKGKETERGHRRPPGPPNNKFSVPRPTGYKGPPPQGPSGNWGIDNIPPFMGIKPLLMRTPVLFKGNHDNIEQFIGDCQTYFEAFQQYYMGHPVLMVVFATSHLEGQVQDWWVHLRDEYWYVPPWDDATDDQGPRYRYPPWDNFVELFRTQFWDPTMEEVHEKQMGEIRMNNDPAYAFFWKIE